MIDVILQESSEDNSLTKEQKEDIREALSELKSKVNFLEERAKVNEIKFHHQDYKDVSEMIYFLAVVLMGVFIAY